MDTEVQQKEAQMYYVPTGRFILLNLATFGIYDIYWGYKQWKFLKQSGKSKKSLPWLAGLFLPVTYYFLIKNFDELNGAPARKYVFKYDALAFLYFAINICYKLPDPYWLISIFSLLPLLYGVNLANNYYLSQDASTGKASGLKWWQIALIIVGLIFLVMSVIGTFIPE